MKYYIDKNQISRLASNTDTYHKGYLYWLNGKVRNMQLTEENGACVATAIVSGQKNDRSVMIAFDAQGILQKYRCMCSSAGIWHGACKHVVAALLHLFEANRENLVISRSARIAGAMLANFETQMYNEAAAFLTGEYAPVIQTALQPRFVFENGKAFVSFSIGQRKRYIVKNLRDFVRRMRTGEVFAYGKDLEIAHTLTSFDGESRDLVRFILREYDALEDMSRLHTGLQHALEQAMGTRNMPLTARGIDTFFALFANQTMEASIYGTGITAVILSDAPPDLQFILADAENGMMLSLEGTAHIWHGEEYDYLLREAVLSRVSKDWCAAVLPILAAFKQLGAQKIAFTSQEAPRVRSFMAARLQKFNLLQGAAAANLSQNALPLVSKAYFDTDGRAVTCELRFCYGEQEINAAHDFASHMDIPRDIAAELRSKALLGQIGFVPDAGGESFRLIGNDQIFRFYHEPDGLAALRESAEVYITDTVRRVAEKPRAQTSVGLRINGNLLEVQVNAEGFPMIEMMDILESYRVKKKFHRLRDGSFINFTDPEESETFEAVDALMQGLGASKRDVNGDTVVVPRFRAVVAGDVLERHQAQLQSVRDQSFRKLLSDMHTDIDCPVPAPLDTVLRTYQSEGFHWLKALDRTGFGGILADDMGLGKTVQIISVLLAEKSAGLTPRRPSIVIAPTSLVYNWEKELARFAPELDVLMVCGTPAHRQTLLTNAAKQADVLITTYDMLKRDIELYRVIDFRFIVADEAQNIKNPATQNAKALKLLQGTTRYALTGTPVENTLLELWSIFDFLMPGYLHSRTKFTKLYEEPILREDSKEAARLLRRQIAPFILRRLKSEVLTELPDKIETTIYAEMTPEQKKVYTAYLMQAKGELSDSIGGNAFAESRIEILSKLTRLRQLCCHPATFMENYAGGSGKLDATLEAVSRSVQAGHRLLIFSQFTKMLAILSAMLDKEDIPYFYLDGATPSRDRLDMAERFNGGECEVFLISLKAGGTGLNLTGADVVIHYDPWWNPAVMEQAADRAHRFGQSKTVQVINIVAKDSVEEKIMTLQAKKRDLIDSVIEEGAHFINQMTRADVEALFA